MSGSAGFAWSAPRVHGRESAILPMPAFSGTVTMATSTTNTPRRRSAVSASIQQRCYGAESRATFLAMLALTGAAVLWGTSFVATKPVLAETSPVLLAWLRFAIAAAVLVPLARIGGGRIALGRREAVLGLTGFALYFLFQNAGLQVATASDATMMLAGGHVGFAAVFGFVFLRERLAAGQLIGLTCAIAGVGVVAMHSGGFGGSTPTGMVLLGGAAACAALHTALGRRAFAGTEIFPVLAGSTLFGALFLSAPAAAEVATRGLQLPDGRELALLVYLGVGCSALAFALSAYGLRHLSAVQNGVFTLLELPVGFGAAILLLSEQVGGAQALGGAFVLSGVILASFPGLAVRRRHASSPVVPALESV
jgi:drug/metabolite transporter (DMT)-like permease